jgi:hypothetical protein
MTPDEHQRLLLGLLLAAHAGDERGFKALLSGVPRAALLVLVRQLSEVVVGGQVVTEEWPEAARDDLAQQALTWAGR